MVADSFTIPSSYYKHSYKNLFSPRYRREKRKKGLAQVFSLSVSTYAGYVLALVISVLFTSRLLESTGMIKNIMNKVREQQILAAQKQHGDHSAINGYVTAHAHLVLHFPDGSRVGEALDGIRYREVKNQVYFSQKRIPSYFNIRNDTVNSFHVSPIESGAYTLQLNCSLSGTHLFALEVYDNDGNKRLMSQSFPCETTQTIKYNLALNKTDFRLTTLTKIN